MNAPVQALTVQERKEVRVVADPIPVLDTARFEHMQRIANVIAASNLIPDSLCMTGTKESPIALTDSQVRANCFLVVNQAVRWGMDPFAVAQCVSVVHGKLCYEGKLIAAVIEAKLGVDLEYEISGKDDTMTVVVTGALDGKPVLDSKGKPKTVSGTVAEWKTSGNGSPWAARGGYPRMLRYRGAREWARVHKPGIILGVYSDDELDAMSEERRAFRARDVTPARGQIIRDEPPPPSEVGTGGDAPLQPTEKAQTDLERAESGRHEPGEVEWVDPPAPDDVAKTATANTVKADLLSEIEKLDTVDTADQFAMNPKVYERRNSLTEIEKAEINLAFLRRKAELNPA